MSKNKMEQNLESCLQSVKIFQSLSDSERIKEYAEKELKLVYPFTISPQPIEGYLYRARTQKSMQCDNDLLMVSSFSYVPKELNKDGKPKVGRFNKKGESIFYASLCATTNLKEMKDDIKEGDIVYLSKWKVKDGTQIKLFHIYPPNAERENPFRNANFDSTLFEILKESGEVLLADRSEDDKYLKTSLISSNIFNFNHKGITYDGICYPSVLGNGNEYNLALKPEFVDAKMKLQCVYEAIVKNDTLSIDCSRIGINKNNRIQWYEFFVYEDDITTGYSFRDKEGNLLTTNNDSFVFYNKVKYTISEFEQILEEKLLKPYDTLYEKGFFCEGEHYIEDALNLIGIERTKCYYIIPHDLKLCTQEFYDTTFLRIEVNYKNSLRPIIPHLNK